MRKFILLLVAVLMLFLVAVPASALYINPLGTTTSASGLTTIYQLGNDTPYTVGTFEYTVQKDNVNTSYMTTELSNNDSVNVVNTSTYTRYDAIYGFGFESGWAEAAMFKVAFTGAYSVFSGITDFS